MIYSTKEQLDHQTPRMTQPQHPSRKKPKYDSPLTEALKQDEDEVMTALNMSEEVTTKVQKIWKS